MSNHWFRMYSDFLEDAKMISLAFEDQRHFIGVLALKSSRLIDQECSQEVMDRLVAQKLWVDRGAITEVKRRLIEAGLIDTQWQPLAWDKRQFVSDRDPTAAERQRRKRDRDRETGDPNDVTDKSRVTVTDKSRVTPRDSHEGVTPLDTDTDTEIRYQRGECEGGATQKRRKPVGAAFAAPSVEECYAYAKEIESPWVAQDFHDHFTANGWRVSGRTPMKDWKAALRKWAREDKRRESEREQRARGYR